MGKRSPRKLYAKNFRQNVVYKRTNFNFASFFLPITFSQCTNKSAIIEKAFLYDSHARRVVKTSRIRYYLLCRWARRRSCGSSTRDASSTETWPCPPWGSHPARLPSCTLYPGTVPSWQFMCFLYGNVTLSALGLPSGKTAVMHLVPRYRAVMAVHVRPPRKCDPVRPGAPIRQDCRHSPCTQVACRHGRSCNSRERSSSLSVILLSHVSPQSCCVVMRLCVRSWLVMHIRSQVTVQCCCDLSCAFYRYLQAKLLILNLVQIGMCCKSWVCNVSLYFVVMSAMMRHTPVDQCFGSRRVKKTHKTRKRMLDVFF